MKKIVGTPEFRLTEDAYNYIVATAGAIHSNAEFKDNFLFISWIINDSSNNEFIPGPNLAFDQSDMGLKNSGNFYSVGELRVIIALDEKRIQECRDKVLDYRAGRLVLIYEDDFVDLKQ